MVEAIQKWVNGLFVRIPRAFAEEMGLTDGALVDLSVNNGNLVVSPLGRLELTLEDLLAGVTENNLHSEQDYGPTLGREAW